MRTRLGLALFMRTHAQTDKPPFSPGSSDLVPALRPAPRGVRPCLAVGFNALVTLTNVDFVNCMFTALSIYNTPVAMKGARHSGVAPLRARRAALRASPARFLAPARMLRRRGREGVRGKAHPPMPSHAGSWLD